MQAKQLELYLTRFGHITSRGSCAHFVHQARCNVGGYRDIAVKTKHY